MKASTLTIATIGGALALGLAIPATAQAQNGERRANMIEQFDTDRSGTISADEYVTARSMRFDEADADGNGELTREEVIDRMERRRLERRASRLLRRMDIDGDGKVTKAETEGRARKRFALMDRDDSGAIESDEMRRGKRGMKRDGKRRDRSERRRSDGNL